MANDTNPDRRAFLKNVGTVGVTGVAAIVTATPEVASAEPQQRQPAPLPAPEPPRTYTFLTPPEAAFVEAAVDRLIPADDLTPGGTACGISTFIDRQLAGAWGTGDRMYMQGPWAKGTPSQGYQLPLTPADFFRTGIAATNAHCRKTYQKDFDRLTEPQQIEVLQGLEQGKISLEHVPAQAYFNLLLNAAMEGFFSDPLYGGNKDKASWKMVGFPGVIAVYGEHIKTYRNRKYDGQPTSIVDLS